MPASVLQKVAKTMVVFKFEDGSTTDPMVLTPGSPSAIRARELASEAAPEGAIRYQTMSVFTPRRGRVGTAAIEGAWNKTGFRNL